MPPPELATNAPILNPIEPVKVSLFPTIRMKFDGAIFDRTFGLFDLWVFKEPLLGEARLNRHVTALRKSDCIFIRLAFD